MTKSPWISIFLIILLLGSVVALYVIINNSYYQREEVEEAITKEKVIITPHVQKTEMQNLKEPIGFTLSPENTTDIDFSSWRDFDNEAFGIRFRYPASWGDATIYAKDHPDTLYGTGISFQKTDPYLSHVSITRFSKEEINNPPARVENILSQGCDLGPGPCLQDVLDFYRIELKILGNYPVGVECSDELNDSAYYGGYLFCKVMQRSDGTKYLLSYSGRYTNKIFTFSSGSFIWLISFEISEYVESVAPDYRGSIIDDIQNGTAPQSLLDELKTFDTMIETIVLF